MPAQFEENFMNIIKNFIQGLSHENTSIENDFIDAILMNDENKVKSLNRQKFDICQPNRDNMTALHAVASTGNVNLLAFILEHTPTHDKEFINAKDDTGNTALHWACYFRNKDMVSQLLNHHQLSAKINTNLVNHFGMTPLMMISQESIQDSPNYPSKQQMEDLLNIAMLLVKHGAQLETRDFLGNTPLLKAGQQGNDLMVRYLIDVKANIEHKNRSGEDILAIGFKNKNMAIIQAVFSTIRQYSQLDAFKARCHGHGQMDNMALERLKFISKKLPTRKLQGTYSFNPQQGLGADFILG